MRRKRLVVHSNAKFHPFWSPRAVSCEEAGKQMAKKDTAKFTSVRSYTDLHFYSAHNNNKLQLGINIDRYSLRLHTSI